METGEKKIRNNNKLIIDYHFLLPLNQFSLVINYYWFSSKISRLLFSFRVSLRRYSCQKKYAWPVHRKLKTVTSICFKSYSSMAQITENTIVCVSNRRIHHLGLKSHDIKSILASSRWVTSHFKR